MTIDARSAHGAREIATMFDTVRQERRPHGMPGQEAVAFFAIDRTATGGLSAQKRNPREMVMSVIIM